MFEQTSSTLEDDRLKLVTFFQLNIVCIVFNERDRKTKTEPNQRYMFK